MAEDGVAEDGAAKAQGPAHSAAAAPPVPVPDPIAFGERPAAVAGFAKTEIFGVAASTVGHLLIGLLIIGSLASVNRVPEAIAVKLIPADQAVQKPPQKPPQDPAQQQKPAAPPAHKAAQTSPPEQKAPAPQEAANDPAKATPGTGKEAPPPGKEAAAAASEKTVTPWRDLAASLGMADFGRQTTLPDTLLAEVSAQVKRCWSVPAGWSNPQQVSVTLRFQLHPDGTLDGTPAVVEFRATPVGAAAAKAAIKAVSECGPFALPADTYEQWKDIQLELAP